MSATTGPETNPYKKETYPPIMDDLSVLEDALIALEGAEPLDDPNQMARDHYRIGPYTLEITTKAELDEQDRETAVNVASAIADGSNPEAQWSIVTYLPEILRYMKTSHLVFNVVNGEVVPEHDWPEAA